MKRILVAGIGNIFFGDDAFGCEVAKELAQRPLPKGVRVIDFGIRSYDLAYAIMDNYDATILVDASPRGSSPGTVYLIEPDLNKLDEAPDEVINAHSMNPVRVLQMVRSLGGAARQLFVVGCEPETLVSEGDLGLSARVRAAVPTAVEMIERLIAALLGSGEISSALRERNPSARLPRFNLREEKKMSVALWAWIILGAIVVVIAIIFIIMMIPEMVRYVKLKSM